MVELQQSIGRARVGRKKPREIQVLIPDYDLSLLGNMEGKLYMQLSAFQKAADNPDFALQYLNQPNPYVCYDAILKKPLVNRIGLVDGIKEPKKVEMALWKLIPPEESNDFCHRLVDHGRAVCTARTAPYCDRCCLNDICKKAGI